MAASSIRPSVRLEQDVGTGELPSRERTFLGQGKKMRPFVLAQCHEISLGHQSLPFLLDVEDQDLGYDAENPPYKQLQKGSSTRR